MVPKSANWMVNGHIAVIFLFAFDCGCCCWINNHSLIGSIIVDRLTEEQQNDHPEKHVDDKTSPAYYITNLFRQIVEEESNGFTI